MVRQAMSTLWDFAEGNFVTCRNLQNSLKKFTQKISLYVQHTLCLTFSFSRLEEDGVLTDCALLTQAPEETLDFDFTAANVTNKIILKVSNWLVGACACPWFARPLPARLPTRYFAGIFLAPCKKNLMLVNSGGGEGIVYRSNFLLWSDLPWDGSLKPAVPLLFCQKEW